MFDRYVKSSISALRFILRHCGVTKVRLIPQDSQALISGFLRSRPNWKAFYEFIKFGLDVIQSIGPARQLTVDTH